MPTLRATVAAPDSAFVHITQNIDGLSSTAVIETASRLGETADARVIEMHGNLFDVICTAHDCDYHSKNTDSPICAALGGTEMRVAEGDIEPVVRRADLPRCPKCEQLLRPDVVWFGERPKRILEILELADRADLCLVVGTSAVVSYSAHKGMVH